MYEKYDKTPGAIIGAGKRVLAEGANAGGISTVAQREPEVHSLLIDLSEEATAVRERVHTLIERLIPISQQPSPEPAEKESRPDAISALGNRLIEERLKLRDIRRDIDDALARLEI